MNISSILKVLANSNEIEAALTEGKSLVTDGVALKTAIADDIAALKAGTLPAGKIETLQAAEKFIADIGKALATVGTLSGNAGLAEIGAGLSAV